MRCPHKPTWATLLVVGLTGVVLLATDVLDEDFEGSGYENTWSETVDTGNTVDEDDTTVTPQTGGGSQTLNIVGGGTNLNAYTEWDNGSGSDADNYIRGYVNFNTIDTGDTDTTTIFALWDGTVATIRLQFRYTGANGRHVTWHIYDNGYVQKQQVLSLSEDTWYRFEARYQSNGAKNYEVRWFTGNSTTADASTSGTIGTTRTGSRYIRVGHHSSGGGSARGDDINFDGIAWGTTGFIGPYSTSSTDCPNLLLVGVGGACG